VEADGSPGDDVTSGRHCLAADDAAGVLDAGDDRHASCSTGVSGRVGVCHGKNAYTSGVQNLVI